MDAKVFRLALLTILSAFILVLVIVYATNAGKINDLLGVRGKKTEQSQKTEEAMEAEEASSAAEASFGDQIGSDLEGFILDDDFFDETEKVPSVVVIPRNSEDGSALGSSESLSDYVKDGAGEITTDVTDVSGAASEGAGNVTGFEDAAHAGEEEDLQDAATAAGSDQNRGSGMAVVGQLINPNPENTAGTEIIGSDSSGYLRSLPDPPPGGYGQYIPAGETIGGTPVGDLP